MAAGPADGWLQSGVPASPAHDAPPSGALPRAHDRRAACRRSTYLTHNVKRRSVATYEEFQGTSVYRILKRIGAQPAREKERTIS